MSQLGDTLKGIVEISKGNVRVLNAKQTQGPLCIQLLETAMQHQQIEMQGTASWLLKMLAPHFGVQLYGTENLDDWERAEKLNQRLFPKIQMKKINTETICIVLRSLKTQKISVSILEISQQNKASFSLMFLAEAIQRAYQGTVILKKIDIEPDSQDENKCFILNPSSELLEGNLNQYLKKFKQDLEIQDLPLPEKMKPSLKDEIALAGIASKQQAHHRLFSS